jgi:hypothetical protein
MPRNAVYTPEAEYQRRIRIRLSLAAYAYEYENTSIMSDAEFDALALKVDPNIDTGFWLMDEFFRKKFSPDTGMWIRDHPQLTTIRNLYHCLSR